MGIFSLRRLPFLSARFAGEFLKSLCALCAFVVKK